MRQVPVLLLLLSALAACAPSSGDLEEDKTTTGETTTNGPGDDGGAGDDGGDGGDGGDGEDGGDDGASGSPDGDLYINEFMASNSSTVQDAGGAYPDWIEIYNAGDDTVDLGGWTISDDLEETDKHALASSLSIEAGGFLLLFADDDEEEGREHVGFNLSAEGESIGLYRPDGDAVDEITYGAMGTDVAMARIPDGSSSWEVTDTATPGASNGD